MSKVEAESKPKVKEAKSHLHRIIIEKVKNGVTVQKHFKHANTGSMMSMPHEEEPSAFIKPNAAHAHIKEATAQMFGGASGGGDQNGEEAGEAEGS